MPKFICPLCRREVSYPVADYEFHRVHFWECSNCYSVIAKERYAVNVKNGKTLFSPMGTALGDVCINEVIKRKYQECNPDEEILFCEDIDTFKNMLNIFKHNKIFWSDLSLVDINDKKIEKPASAIWYSIASEVNTFMDKGFYPELAIMVKKPNIDETFDVILHLRNVAKCKDKNISFDEADKILDILQGMTVGLVGNDKIIDGENLGSVTDLRNILSLSEIAWLMQRTKLFIGKDSGMVHFAGVCNVPYLISWNYVSNRWFPKTRSKGEYFIKKEGFDKALKAVKRFLINNF